MGFSGNLLKSQSALKRLPHPPMAVSTGRNAIALGAVLGASVLLNAGSLGGCAGPQSCSGIGRYARFLQGPPIPWQGSDLTGIRCPAGVVHTTSPERPDICSLMKFLTTSDLRRTAKVKSVRGRGDLIYRGTTDQLLGPGLSAGDNCNVPNKLVLSDPVLLRPYHQNRSGIEWYF